jgi:hypothetical protein
VVVAKLEIDEVHRLSLDEYHRIIEAGGFDVGARVELLEGVLARMSPQTQEHENAIAWLNRSHARDRRRGVRGAHRERADAGGVRLRASDGRGRDRALRAAAVSPRDREPADRSVGLVPAP